MMNKNWQLKCVKAFYDITGELDEYKEKELSTFGNNMYMLFMSGIILGFLLSFMFTTDCVSVITFFSILLLSVPTRAGDSSFVTRYLWGFRRWSRRSEEKNAKKELSFKPWLWWDWLFLVAIGLWRTGLLQENKISFEMYFTYIFPSCHWADYHYQFFLK